MSQTGTYTTQVAKKDTMMSVTGFPPTERKPGESYHFSGFLQDTGGFYLPGKKINLVVNGVVKKTTTTAGIPNAGYWEFTDSFTEAGTYYVYAEFPGDDTYNGSKTTTYTIVVRKLKTSMTVTVAPPTTASPDTDISFQGNLKDEYGGLLSGKTVDIYVDGVKVDSKTTDTEGKWIFVFRLSPGTHTSYVSFAGDAQYEGCDEELSLPENPDTRIPLVIAGVACAVGFIVLVTRRH